MGAAFHSGQHGDLQNGLKRLLTSQLTATTNRAKCNIKLVDTRRREQVLGEASDDNVYTLIATGGQMGDSNEPLAFMYNFNSTLYNYLATTHQVITKPFIAQSPFNQTLHNLSISTFTDDILRILTLDDDEDDRHISNMDALALTNAITQYGYTHTKHDKERQS